MSFVALMDGGTGEACEYLEVAEVVYFETLCNKWFKLRLGREVRLKKWMAKEGFIEASFPWQT